LQCRIARMDDMPRMIAPRRGARNAWPFRVFLDSGINLRVSPLYILTTHLDRVNIDGKDTRAVVCEQGREWPAHDLRARMRRE
jgi:hypothetical protein